MLWERAVFNISEASSPLEHDALKTEHLEERFGTKDRELSPNRPYSSLPSPQPLLGKRGFLKQNIKTWTDGEILLEAPLHVYPDEGPLEPLQMSTTDDFNFNVDGSSEHEIVFERASATDSNPWYECKSIQDDILQFESRFESGCLDKAVRISRFEYALTIHGDPGSDRKWAQWFYFSIKNARPDVEYTFHLMHFNKGDSLFGKGCMPLMSSSKSERGWSRIGSNISYYQNSSKKYTLTFSFQLDSKYRKETHYFAACYPYRYSDLQSYLDELESDPIRSSRVKRRTLCRTLAGNQCDLLTITSFGSGNDGSLEKRRGVLLSARVHPGESNASWMMKGVIDFLTGPSLDAKLLRDNFVFKIVPMLNPDGVISGRARASHAGVDLNRMYIEPDKKFHPTIWHLKRLLQGFTSDRDVLLYCDFHGHSRKHNVFMYGCLEGKQLDKNSSENENDEVSREEQVDETFEDVPESKKIKIKKKKRVKRKNGRKTKKRVKEVKEFTKDVTLFPQLLQISTSLFSFSDCSFRVQKSKESTGRVNVYRESDGEILSYTLEASLGGMDVGPLKGNHLNYNHFEQMGHAFCDALLEYLVEEQKSLLK